MPLKNFGSILNFAAELEAADHEFYKTAGAVISDTRLRAILEELAAEKKKNEKLMRRTCRESVCEMILEPIVDFTRDPFLSGRGGTEAMSWEQLLERAVQLESKAVAFYMEAAEKIRALPEVSRALARTGTRRAADKKRLEDLGGKGGRPQKK
ncbi:MAG: ferritin-like domain-containing protein [Pseudomonadota bacterium]